MTGDTICSAVKLNVLLGGGGVVVKLVLLWRHKGRTIIFLLGGLPFS